MCFVNKDKQHETNTTRFPTWKIQHKNQNKRKKRKKALKAELLNTSSQWCLKTYFKCSIAQAHKSYSAWQFSENLRADFSASFVHAPGIRLLDSKKTIVMLGVLDVALFAMADSALFPMESQMPSLSVRPTILQWYLSMIFFFVAK